MVVLKMGHGKISMERAKKIAILHKEKILSSSFTNWFLELEEI